MSLLVRLIALADALCPGLTVAEPVPISAFARPANIKLPTISPDGRYLAYVSVHEGRRVALTVDLDLGGQPTPVIYLDEDSDYDFGWCKWANDTRLLCGFLGTSPRRARDGQIVGVNADGADQKILTKYPYGAYRLLDTLPGDPVHVLVERIFPRDVLALDAYTGESKVLERSKALLQRFESDGRGNIRLASGIEGRSRLIFGRLLGSSKWRQIASSKLYQFDGIVPVAIIPGTNRAYATASVEGRDSLLEVDLEDRDPARLIFSHPLSDVGRRYVENGELLGIKYETDRPFVHYVDSMSASVMEAVNKQLPLTFNEIESVSQDRQKFLIASRSDVDAGTFYLFDLKSRVLRELGSVYPELKRVELARMRSIEYPASDGTMIPGYLTVPVGKRAERLPLVVMPHGGPITRDSWEFDFLRQFIASRGYAVLSGNFRGSAGYGAQWFQAAYQDWGGLTYSDITDGARWAAASGVADPERMCIVGWSFGGYAALLGAVRNRDLYKCAVSIAGLSYLPALRGGIQVQLQLGWDRRKRRDSSPSVLGRNGAAPVLMIHGARDVQAPVEQSRRMAQTLETANVVHELIVLPKGEHALWRESERIVILQNVEAFLGEHLREKFGQGESSPRR